MIHCGEKGFGNGSSDWLRRKESGEYLLLDYSDESKTESEMRLGGIRCSTGHGQGMLEPSSNSKSIGRLPSFSTPDRGSPLIPTDAAFFATLPAFSGRAHPKCGTYPS